MIEFQHVSKAFGNDIYALRDVSLTIGDGELVFLAGPSGAGKSTLLRMIAGLEKPSSGTVLMNGQNLGQLKASSLPYLRRKLGLILQGQGLLLDRSVLANVMLPMIVVGESTTEAETRARAALDRLNILDKAHASPLALSGGEQQRVAIARAIVNRPKIILADEPTAYLDRDNAIIVINALKAFQRSGVTCIISSHDEQFLEQANRVIYLSKGEVTDSWTSAVESVVAA
ncbi:MULTISPECIES: cell division ATP-binding protein FtsE [Undibacterium]|jgi:cell division transport system ATP-binding protein|uniref:Cell division ATP-binding protein FtsE n=2 Tax=Undibacterium TaxID=401469 RepID=A0A941I356_9BURK|nr:MULTISPECIES: ATP-binding cassette domain-containing protein [Undibacterium]MBR7748208.1 ATP-binding cassette domain-containing protein [Undibacterium baiyunense]GGX16378.1 GMP synthase [Undibacterium macrobrachii]